MTQYELLGGGVISAENAKDLVTKLNENSLFGNNEDLHLFMAEIAERCKIQNRGNVRSDSFENFAEDLEKYKFITKI